MMRRALLAAVAAAPALGGCRLGPDYQRPELDLPPQFRATAESAGTAWPDPAWWRGFGLPELDALVGRARAANTDLLAARRPRGAGGRARADQRRPAAAGAQWNRGLLLPPGRDQQQPQRLGFRRGRYVDSRSYGLGLSVSYDLDFWGRNRRCWNRRRRRRWAAGRPGDGGADRCQLGRDHLFRGAGGAGPGACGGAQPARLRAHPGGLPRAPFGRHRLGVGRVAAGGAGRRAAGRDPQPAEQRGAEPHRTRTADRDTAGAAGRPGRVAGPGDGAGGGAGPAQRAAAAAAGRGHGRGRAGGRQRQHPRRPRRLLPGRVPDRHGGLSSLALSTLTGPGTLAASLAAALTQPIFDNGLRRGQLDQAKGRNAELVAGYVRAVLQSLTDVEQALTAIRYLSEQEMLEREAVRVAQRSADIANAQLQAGTIDIIISLNTQVTLVHDLDLLVQIRLARLQALVNLFKALGGGWKDPRA